MTNEVSETEVSTDAFGYTKWKVSSVGFAAFYVIDPRENRHNSRKRFAAFEAVIRAAFK